MEKAAYVYRITNMLNGMQYIGVTVNPKRRFQSHCRPAKTTRLLLKNAIQKHGKENFRMEVLLQATQAYCYEMEPRIIAAYGTLKPSGYNLTAGGMGSLGLIGQMNGCYGRNGPKHPNFGKSGYRKGIPHTEETKAKMRAARLGRKQSEEVKAKIGAAQKAKFADATYIEKMKQSGFCVGRPRKQKD
jgi:group I intron endonuclease